MKKRSIYRLGVGLALLSSIPAFAQTDTSDQIKELQRRLEELDRKYRALEQRVATNDAVISEKAKQVPLVSVGSDGFRLQSLDGNFKLALEGVIQFDTRNFIDNVGGKNNIDAFLLRRVRPILEGTVYRDFSFYFQPDCGPISSAPPNTVSPTVYDAFLNYQLIPELQLQAGKFKAPVGLEHLQSDANLELNERGFVYDLSPDRDIGVELHGSLFEGVLNYAAGIFNGVGDAQGSTFNTPSDNYKTFDARIFVKPFSQTKIDSLRGLGFGLAGTYGNEQAGASPAQNLTAGYKTDGQQTFFSYSANVSPAGDAWHLNPEASYYYGPFSLLAEYVVSDQELADSAAKGAGAKIDAQNTAWQIQGGWVLTGEDASYTGVKPAHPLDPLHGGGWGAWEVVARYQQLSADNNIFTYGYDTAGSARDAASFTVGLNWYLNNNIRFMLDYAHTTFGHVDSTSSSILVTRGDENAILTRLQLAF